MELSLTATILQEFSYKAIIAASTDEEHPVLKDSKAALIIYYAGNRKVYGILQDNIILPVIQ